MHIGGCKWLWGGENEEQLFSGYRFLCWGDENIWGQDRGGGCPTF